MCCLQIICSIFILNVTSAVFNIDSIKKGSSRIAVKGPSENTYHFRSNEVSLSKLRQVFGISPNETFFLVDENNNIEFVNDSGYFTTAVEGPSYQIQFAKSSVTKANGERNICISSEICESHNDKGIDWSQSYLLDLSGGSAGFKYPGMLHNIYLILYLHDTVYNILCKIGQKEYIADLGQNDVTVTSSAVSVPTYTRYTDPEYYRLENLFNGLIRIATFDSFWLAKSHGDQTLTISFQIGINLESVHISAVIARNYECRSDYSVDVFDNNCNRWIDVSGIIRTSADGIGYMRSHSVRRSMSEIRINLRPKGDNGACLKEIDLYVV